MMKNRNVHSLCLVLHRASSPPPPAATPPSLELPSLPLWGLTLASDNVPQSAPGAVPSRQTQISGTIPPLRGAQGSLEKGQPEVSCLLSCSSAAFSSESSIFKEGVITPITPNFSPETRAHQTEKQFSSSPTNLKSHGTRNMQSGHSRFPTANCSTPDSLDDNASWQCDDGGLAQHQVHSLGRYVSLSNLPTPPLSDSSISPVLFPEACGDDSRSSDLNAAAQYLASLIPTSASASPPSIPLIRRILYRVNVRIEVIALAGIILDTLSAQFVRKWRTELARVSLWEDGGNKCEVLALVALGIAVKWLEDSGVSLTTSALSDMSGEHFCPREINVTERLMLQDVGYGLKGMSCEADIAWSVREIERWKRVGDNTEDY